MLQFHTTKLDVRGGGSGESVRTRALCPVCELQRFSPPRVAFYFYTAAALLNYSFVSHRLLAHRN